MQYNSLFTTIVGQGAPSFRSHFRQKGPPLPYHVAMPRDGDEVEDRRPSGEGGNFS